MLKFQNMQRVAVVDPQVADVAVVSTSELLVKAGDLAANTMLYVWDRAGLHKFAITVVGVSSAERVANDLRQSLGSGLTVRAFNDQMVIVEGQVKDEEARANLQSLLGAASTDNVTVVSMVTAKDTQLTPAGRIGETLSSLLGPNVKVTAWGDNVLVVEGEPSDQNALMRARQIIGALSGEVKIVDMLTLRGQSMAAQAPVAQIQQLLGEGFQVRQMQGNLIAVEGIVQNQEQLDRVNRVLDAFQDQAQTINLVQVVPPKPDLQMAQAALQGALNGQVTVKQVGEEALMLEGSVPSAERLAQIGQVLDLFKGRVPIINLVSVVEPGKTQVLVGVKVLEINRSDTDNLGIDWGTYGLQNNVAVYQPQPFLWGETHDLNGQSGLHRLYPFGQQISALVQAQKAKVLSEPNLLVNEGEEAEILIGGEIPIPIVQGGTAGAIGIEYKPYGVNLQIMPTISPDRTKVQLVVTPEVSSLDYGNGVIIGGISIPGLRTRRASTIVTIPDNGILAIGGLIQSDQSKVIDKIPLLGDIPILGQLFRHDTFKNNKSELIILVMPQIIDENGQPLHPIPMPEGMEGQSQFNLPPSTTP